MGYYTNFELTVEINPHASQLKGVRVEGVDAEAVIAAFRNQNSNAAYALTELGNTGERAKWYDAEVELGDFSKQYPALLFVLDGIGEDAERFRIYAANGKTQRVAPAMMFPPFDPGA